LRGRAARGAHHCADEGSRDRLYWRYGYANRAATLH